MKEIWKDILNFEDSYQVSNLGHVRTKERQRKCGSGSRVWVSVILKPQRYSKKYLSVNLFKNSKNKLFLIHKLVYENFVGKVPHGLTIDHKDNNQLNNNLDNLGLLTNRANVSKYYLQSEKSSSFVGVCKHQNKWQASIRVNKERFYLGRFFTEQEASIAYQNAKIQYGVF